jgi:hypothetical protein
MKGSLSEAVFEPAVFEPAVFEAAVFEAAVFEAAVFEPGLELEMSSLWHPALRLRMTTSAGK